MRQYVNPTNRLQGPITWFQILSFTPGATFSIDDGATITILGNYAIPALKNRHGHVVPWSAISFTGNVTVNLGDLGEPFPGHPGVVASNVIESRPVRPTFTAWSAFTADNTNGFLIQNAPPLSNPKQLITKVHRFTLWNPGAVAVASVLIQIQLRRYTCATPGNSGQVLPGEHGFSNALTGTLDVFNGTCRFGLTSGFVLTLGPILDTITVSVPLTTPGAFTPIIYDFTNMWGKPWEIPLTDTAGVVNGIGFIVQSSQASAGAAGSVSADFTQGTD